MALIDELCNDYDKADAFVHLLISHSTGGPADEGDFLSLRSYFIANSQWSSLVPVTNQNLTTKRFL